MNKVYDFIFWSLKLCVGVVGKFLIVHDGVIEHYVPPFGAVAFLKDDDFSYFKN